MHNKRPRKKKIIGPTGEEITKIEFASDIETRRLAPYINRILETIGYSYQTVLVTDKSCLSDFSPDSWIRDGVDPDPSGDRLREWITMALEQVGLPFVEAHEYLVDMAKRLAEQEGDYVDHPSGDGTT